MQYEIFIIISVTSTQSLTLNSIMSLLRNICSMNFRNLARCSNHWHWNYAFWYWVSQSKYFSAIRMHVNLSASITSKCNNIAIRNMIENTMLQISSTERQFMHRHSSSAAASDDTLLYKFSVMMMMRAVMRAAMRINQFRSILL